MICKNSTLFNCIEIAKRKHCLLPSDNQYYYHYAFAIEGNKVIFSGKNYPNSASIKALKIGQMFNIRHFKMYPFLHAEMDIVSKLLDNRYLINKNITLFSLRLNGKGKIRLGKPCRFCASILHEIGIKNICWTTNNDIVRATKDEFSRMIMSESFKCGGFKRSF